MPHRPMFPSIINRILILVMLVSTSLQAQQNSPVIRDSLSKGETYGVRIGVDLSRPLFGALKTGYSGLELVGDYRLSHRLYLAAELGNESKTITENLNNVDNLNIIPIYNLGVTGSYLKAGVDYNTYENWFGMKNNIIVGARYAFSTFQTDLNSFNYFNSNRYWNPEGFVSGTDAIQQFKGNNATWLEILLGIKTELFANIFLCASVRIGKLVTRNEPDNLPHLWIPGFNRVTEGSSFGTNFNYSLSYLIPLYRKSRAIEKE